MVVPDHVKQTLGLLERKLVEREQEVIDLKKQINAFCKMFELPESFPEVEDAASPSVGGTHLRLDQFRNDRSPGGAVQHLLELRGKELGAMPIADVYATLRDHGYPFDGRVSDAKNLSNLRVAIGKDRKLHRISSNDAVGLAAWYVSRRRKKDGTSVEDVDVDDDTDGGEDSSVGDTDDAEDNVEDPDETEEVSA